MARFFIEHPVFAMVIAIVIVILGAVAIPSLPVASYPEVVPPVVQITTSYLGGNSLDLEKTVSQPIEEQLIGLDGMLFFLSSSGNDGVEQTCPGTGLHEGTRNGYNPRSGRVRRQGLEPRTRGLRVC